jgi:alanine-synthesizing transaminase
VEFRRVEALPPYAFAAIDALKRELRRSGLDVVDLGFGNPDIPSPEIAVERLRDAVLDPRNHRYSASRGIPGLRRAVARRYAREFGVDLDPETQVTATIGAKEGLVHLLWVLVEPGDTCLVPTPAYPIHSFAPILAGARAVPYHVTAPDVAGEVAALCEEHRPRAIIASYPHNPTTATATPELLAALVDAARACGALLVHDFAYAGFGYDGHEPPSVLQVPRAEEVAVELYTLTKSFSMAGWRVGFAVGNAPAVAALARLKSYLDYGTFQPIQIAAAVALDEAGEYPEEVREQYLRRRDTLCAGLARIGWPVEPPRGAMFVWAPIPERYVEEGSQAFARRLAVEARVAVSPGAGFGEAGEGYVRFALVENEQRIRQAVRGIGAALRLRSSASPERV